MSPREHTRRRGDVNAPHWPGDWPPSDRALVPVMEPAHLRHGHHPPEPCQLDIGRPWRVDAVLDRTR
jgi:hypothetical protein